MTTSNDRLLNAVRERSKKSTEFGYGVTLASNHVKSLQDSIGLQACYQHLSQSNKGTWASFDDVLRKAAQTLVYSNSDMEVEGRWEKNATGNWQLPEGFVAPKNTLMVFKHVLTSSRKDRDGDILRTRGAMPDPRMLLLFNHVHTMPIGKFLGVAEHTDRVLKPYSAIVDMNDLSHDCAVMIDNDMGRFSHGFRAIEFMEIKMDRQGDSPGGYDVKEFEIMEESLVSVPANPDADTEEVLLSLVEGGKMTSAVMKEYGKGIRDHRSIRVPVTIDLKTIVNGQEVGGANESRDEEGEGRGQTGSSKEADGEAEGKEREGTEDKEVEEVEEKKALLDDAPSGGEEANPLVAENEDEGKKKLVCPECEYEGPAKEGVCPECGAEMKEEKKGKKFYVGGLTGSWEWIRENLQEQMKSFLLSSGISITEQTWVSIEATFPNKCLVSVQDSLGKQSYYDVKYSISADGKVSFQGEPKSVEIKIDMMEKTFVPPGGKPYPNEHAMRLNDPGKYDKVRRQNDKFGSGIHAIFGVTADGKTELQAIRFSSDKFSAEEAKEWLEEHKYKTGGFEEATGKEKGFADEKRGRVLSKANEGKLRDAFDDLGDAEKMDGVPRGCKALIKQSRMSVKEILSSLEEEIDGVEKEWTVKEAMAFVLAKAEKNDLIMLKMQVEAFEQGRLSASRTSQYKRLVGGMS